MASDVNRQPASQDNKTSAYPRVYIAGLIIGIILFVPSLAIAHMHQLHGFQERIFYDFNNLPDYFRLPALWITEGLGAGYPIVACIVIPALFKRWRLAWRFFFTIGGTGVVMELAKIFAKEPRPYILLHNHLHVRATELGLNSFPSGHEAVATAMALTLWLILPRNWRWLSVFWILIVGVSRLYLGVHAPVDIIGGFAIGLLAVCVVRLLPLQLAKRLHLDNDRRLLEPGF